MATENFSVDVLIGSPTGLHRHRGCWRSNFSLGRIKLGSSGKIVGEIEISVAFPFFTPLRLPQAVHKVSLEIPTPAF